jgi:ABC-type glycerol-3-phosphate transport system substrate-binding protein
VALFYNRKLFKKAGVSSLPANWNEFIEVARKLTIDTNNDGRPDIYGFGMWGGLWFNFPFFNTFGVKFTDESGKKCLLYSENAKNALSLMLKIANSGIEGGAWQTGAINPELGFLQEMYAMVFAGPWNVKRFKDAGIDFGVVLIPEGPAGTSTNVGGTNMVILRETKYPRECYEFLKFFTSPEVQAEWCNALGQIPVNTKAIPKIDFSKNPEIKVFTEQMKTAIARPPVLDYDRLEEIMTAEIYAVLSKQKTPDKALNDAVKRIENEVLSFE